MGTDCYWCCAWIVEGVFTMSGLNIIQQLIVLLVVYIVILGVAIVEA